MTDSWVLFTGCLGKNWLNANDIASANVEVNACILYHQLCCLPWFICQQPIVQKHQIHKNIIKYKNISQLGAL